MKHRKHKGKPPRGDRQKPQNSSPKAGKRGQSERKSPRLNIDLYGTHAVQAALDNPARQIHMLYATQNAADNLSLPKGLEPSIVQKDDLDRALPQGAVHQGVGVNCAPLPEIGLPDLLIKAENADKTLLLILDQVTDPHNVGAILRSACAFGAQGIIMQKKHAPMIDGVLAKTACGAIEHVDVAYETNLSRSIEELQGSGFFVYGLDERGDDIAQMNDLPDKIALVLGAEGPGIRRLVKEHCDGLLRLPMDGPMPSINVSNAAAVALYALRSKI